MKRRALTAGLAGFPRLLRREDPFVVIQAQDDVRSATRQLPIILASQVIRFLLFAANAYLLTLLVEPAEFGRLLMVGVPVSAVNLFGDLGLGDGVVRTKDLDRSLASFFFWTNAVVSGITAAVLVGVMPFFEAWFDGVALLDLGIAFAFVIVLQGSVSQYRAILRRQLRIGSISFAEIFVTLASASIGVTAAVAGMGALSIPLGRIGGLLVELALLAHLSGWIPGRIASLKRARPVLGFGFKLAFAGVFHFGTHAVAAFFLGRYFPPEALGFVERALELSRGVTVRFKQVVLRVAYPVLARRVQDDPRGGTILGSRMILMGGMMWIFPCAVSIGLMPVLAQELLGDDWLGIGTYLSWAWLALLLWLPSNVAVSLLLAHGKSGFLVKFNILVFVVQMFVMAAGLWKGLLVYIALLGISSALLAFLQILLIGRRCGGDWRSWAGHILRLLLVSVPPAFGLIWIGSVAESSYVLGGGLVLIAGWLIAVALRSKEIQMLLPFFLGRRSPEQGAF